ncbi:cytochrome c oxidase assembly protein [Parvibaculum sedimenti]|uniref:Cytochrome c oxidase assembly protein CtaG n=1 Tax=Parvibaculum sedimenti TaxID=2608632 RepID=A0A6N6VJ77_9HYPH|nr:cytochrome c oxidase assembly protein [Parvibaculum sedimenti]KAB7741137.1 cytochrome c oxidase assembly protein [Parvibaculum sedimenti]
MFTWLRSKKLPSVGLSLFMLAVMTAGVSYSPTLYRWFCAATGYGGSVTEKRSTDTETYTQSNAIGPEITVRFDTNVAPSLDWEFKPEEVSVKTHIGLPTTVYFLAKNLSKETIVARATYNVTPEAAGYYFTKTQCFCFTEETLKPGESARMPVVFYVDPEMLTDTTAKSIRTITLSYTFFRLDATKDAVAAARPLADASKAEAEALARTKEAEFQPPEIRR